MYREIRELELPQPPFLRKWKSIYLIVIIYLTSVISSLYLLSTAFK